MIIDLPKRRRRRWSATAGPGLLPAGVRILGFEVTQAVQNMSHDVRLIAGKPAVVRVYIDPSGLRSNLRVRGEIVVSRGIGTPGTYVGSANEVVLSPKQSPGLDAQRRDATLSLNFLLPSPDEGPLVVQLKRISPVAGGEDFPVLPDGNRVEVGFVPGPVLRMRVLGLRYTDRRTGQSQQHAPGTLHFDRLRSYLKRVYPVSAIDWSQSVIDSPLNFAPPFSGTTLPDGSDPLWGALLDILHQQLLTIRQADMNAGWDPRTHYYGLVSDQSGFFRGAANNVPTAPAPNTVAVGPCGKAPPGHWDQDDSYGDWYGAHELAHTFGRFHPGFCNQDNSDTHFPHPQGAISHAEEDCVGFDTGDLEQGRPMRAYPHEEWKDFMTYCDYQWVSKYTYDAIYSRLVQEDAQFAPSPA